jgi:hypothetical protein
MVNSFSIVTFSLILAIRIIYVFMHTLPDVTNLTLTKQACNSKYTSPCFFIQLTPWKINLSCLYFEHPVTSIIYLGTIS